MTEYKVVATIQSLATDKAVRINDPVVIPWYRGTSEASALAAVANIVADAQNKYNEVLSVTVEFIRPEPAPWEF